MAVTNTGIVLRTITGVNESDLFLDSESTSVTTNTGIVERSVVGVHDANFVHPIGDELIVDGGFDDASNWTRIGNATIQNGYAELTFDGTTGNQIRQTTLTSGKIYKVQYEILSNTGTDGQVFVNAFSNGTAIDISVGTYTLYLTAINTTFFNFRTLGGTGGSVQIDNISVKEMLVNRESTTTNTGIVERAITGSNESELWLDAESTSVVNNTGIVERPITGVNESDPMFPDNTISNIVNIAGLISSLLADLEARATTFENREATQNILINLQKC